MDVSNGKCGTMTFLIPVLALFCNAVPSKPANAKQPNVLVIITDDQGYGDLGCHGNPRIKTPNLDRLAGQGIEISSFYVCPVCSPTRACLLTGRYNYRTGICDTFLGRSMMFADETTLAEHLAAAGYVTGIFGKWHLGDSFPMRSMDQGFQNSLVHRGGGLRQASDHPDNEGYFNPTLYLNGVAAKQSGYCSDVYAAAAISFIEANRARPFFVYLPFNCPHSPLEVAKEEVAPYRNPPLSLRDFPAIGQPVGSGFSADTTAKVYAMVTNVDRNVGNVLSALDRLELANDTIVIFLTDNGPQQPRFNAGMRGLKGTVYDGGIRVPFFMRWPARLPAGKKVDLVAAHIDVVPTVLAACQVVPAKDSKPFDGIDVLPILEGKKSSQLDRTLFFQWHRGNIPEARRACAVRTDRWKLVQAKGNQGNELTGEEPFELFDIQTDPFETKDVAAANPEIVESLSQRYEQWFETMKAERNFALPRIQVGRPEEPDSLLTQQDWRGPDSQRIGVKLGRWQIDAAAGAYRLLPIFKRKLPTSQVEFVIGDSRHSMPLSAAQADGFNWLAKAGPTDIEITAIAGAEKIGPDYLRIVRAGE